MHSFMDNAFCLVVVVVVFTFTFLFVCLFVFAEDALMPVHPSVVVNLSLTTLSLYMRYILLPPPGATCLVCLVFQLLSRELACSFFPRVHGGWWSMERINRCQL